MDTEDVPSEGKSDLEGQGAKEDGSRSLWDQSVLLAVVRVLDNPGMLKGFFNVLANCQVSYQLLGVVLAIRIPDRIVALNNT